MVRRISSSLPITGSARSSYMWVTHKWIMHPAEHPELYQVFLSLPWQSSQFPIINMRNVINSMELREASTYILIQSLFLLLLLLGLQSKST
jgi:hypothetical protein